MLTFNESKKARELMMTIKNSSTIKLQDLKLVAKYFYSTYSYSERENLEQDLKKFLYNILPEYNQNKYDDYVFKCIEYCKTYNLMNRDMIPLTKNELNVIKNIQDNEARRLMFVLLMYSKNRVVNNVCNNDNQYDKERLFYSGSISEIFKLAKVKYNLDNNIKVRKILQDSKLVEWGFGDWCEILFYEYQDDDIEIEFVPEDSLVEYIIGYEDSYKSMICPNCGNWFHVVKKNTKTKLCYSCSQIAKKEKDKERFKKHKEKHKIQSATLPK